MRVSPTPPRSGLCLGPVYSDLSRLLTDVLFEAVQWVAAKNGMDWYFFCCRGYLCEETWENVIRYDTGIGEAVKLPSFIARSLSCRLIRCRLIWCCPKKSGKKSAPFVRTPPFFFSKPSVAKNTRCLVRNMEWTWVNRIGNLVIEGSPSPTFCLRIQ